MKKLFIYLITSGFIFSASAQDNDKKAEVSAQSKTITSSLSSGFLPSQNSVALNASNDGTVATANINYRFPESTWKISLLVSSPVSGKDQVVKPLTLSGLSGGSSLKLATQKILFGKFKYDQNGYNDAIRSVGKDPDNFNYESLTSDEKISFDNYTREHAAVSWGTCVYIGGAIGFEKQQFSYLTDSSKSSHNEDRTNFATSLTANLGILNDKSGVWAASFNYLNGHKADDAVTYSIAGAHGLSIQKDLSPAPPTHTTQKKIRIEYLSIGLHNSGLRINPNVTAELTTKSLSFQLPVYFLKTTGDNPTFNGGIYFGYVSDSQWHFNGKIENFGVGVFLGSNIANLFK